MQLDWNIFARKVNQNTWTKRQIALQGHVRYVNNSLLYILNTYPWFHKNIVSVRIAVKRKILVTIVIYEFENLSA